MPLAVLESLLQHSDPAFACYACKDRLKKEAFIAPVSHRANRPADSRLLEHIPSIPDAEAASRFYGSHDGALLYTAPGLMSKAGGPDEGIEIFPINEWTDRTTQMVDSWQDGGYEDDQMPYGRHDFIAFAHSRGASSYIHWVTRGPRAGAIYWWAWTMPPKKQGAPLAPSFSAFVEIICTQPVHFLNNLLLCYTRFSEGKTGTQWIPNRYLHDRNRERIA
jgi:hypothetical protein